jgi:pyrroline-5-carboxylate reductase
VALGIIGAGNLGRALARGLGEPVLVSDAAPERARAVAEEVGGEAVVGNAELAARADLVVLCHKPAELGAVASQVGGGARRIVSCVGATSIDRLREAYPDAAVVRAMPNTALEVGEAVVALAEPEAADADLHARAVALFERVGTVVVLPEALMPLAQASAGGMPAYVSLVAEAQVDALVRRGLPPDVASTLVVGAIPGAARLIQLRGMDTLAVRRAVTSPGGTTARALAALERGGLRTAFSAALDEAVGA